MSTALNLTRERRALTTYQPAPSFGVVTKLRTQIHLDEPSLFRKIFKPVGACSAYIKTRLLFPGHFVPAPFFNEGTSLIGT
jgi:hypothetical protein